MSDLLEINDQDREAIANLIKEGNTSGRLDSKDENGNAVYITWSIDMEKWQDKLCNCGIYAGFHEKQEKCK